MTLHTYPISAFIENRVNKKKKNHQVFAIHQYSSTTCLTTGTYCFFTNKSIAIYIFRSSLLGNMENYIGVICKQGERSYLFSKFKFGVLADSVPALSFLQALSFQIGFPGSVLYQNSRCTHHFDLCFAPCLFISFLN